MAAEAGTVHLKDIVQKLRQHQHMVARLMAFSVSDDDPELLSVIISFFRGQHGGSHQSHDGHRVCAIDQYRIERVPCLLDQESPCDRASLCPFFIADKTEIVFQKVFISGYGSIRFIASLTLTYFGLLLLSCRLDR